MTFQWLTAQRINVISSYGMNPLQCFGLNGHQEFQTGDVYVVNQRLSGD